MNLSSTFKLTATLVLICCAGVLGADETRVTASVSLSTITIGDPVEYTQTVAHPAGAAVSSAPAAAFAPWEVRALTTTENAERTGTTLKYTLTVFSTGQMAIPETVITVKDPSGKVSDLKSPPVPVTVASVLSRLGDTGDIRDIKPPLTVPVPLWVYLAWLGGIAAAIALGIFAYRKYRQKKGLVPAAPAEPPVPPGETARLRLEALKTSALVAEGRIKEYYSALTEIVRDYLAAVYAVDTRDRTTAEIFAQLRRAVPDRKMLSVIKDFFEAADLVKFAKHRPDEAECTKDWDTAWTITQKP